MSTRFVKGQARTETPRVKDLHLVETERDPSEGRGESGRFAVGNRHASGQGLKALIRRGVGDPHTQIGREALRLYAGLLRALPSDGPGVRQLVASQARHATLAAFYSAEAAKVGLATDEGLKLAEAARSHDTTAQRLGVTAYDRAVREAAAKKPPKPGEFADWQRQWLAQPGGDE